MTPPKSTTPSARRTRVWLAIVLTVALVMVAALATTIAGGDRPAPPAQTGSAFSGALMPAGIKAPSFRLRDQDGRRVDLRQLAGRVALVTFVYSTCTESCGPQLQLIRAGLNELGRDVPVLAVSADPRVDTPRRARRFLLEQHMTGRARFLLGTPQELAPVYRGFFVQAQTDATEHHARIVLLDRTGAQRIGYTLANTEPEQIARDIQTLERERG
jgi:protein SCO1/2